MRSTKTRQDWEARLEATETAKKAEFKRRFAGDLTGNFDSSMPPGSSDSTFEPRVTVSEAASPSAAGRGWCPGTELAARSNAPGAATGAPGSTPHAAAWPALGNRKATLKLAIIDRLSRTGAPAAAAKRSCAFRSADRRVTSVMNRR